MPKHFLLLLLPGKCIKRKRLSVYEREREKDRRDSLLRGAPIIACSWLLLRRVSECVCVYIYTRTHTHTHTHTHSRLYEAERRKRRKFFLHIFFLPGQQQQQKINQTGPNRQSPNNYYNKSLCPFSLYSSSFQTLHVGFLLFLFWPTTFIRTRKGTTNSTPFHSLMISKNRIIYKWMDPLHK